MSPDTICYECRQVSQYDSWFTSPKIKANRFDWSDSPDDPPEYKGCPNCKSYDTDGGISELLAQVAQYLTCATECIFQPGEIDLINGYECETTIDDQDIIVKIVGRGEFSYES